MSTAARAPAVSRSIINWIEGSARLRASTPLCVQTQLAAISDQEIDVHMGCWPEANSIIFVDVTKMASSDIQEIKALNAKYNFSMDEGDAEAWASCFTADGVFNGVIDGEKPKGAEQLKAFVATGIAAFGTMYHLTTNEIISVDGESARQKCYLQFFTKKDVSIDGFICVYDDWLKRENGVWKYSRRDVISKDKFTHLKN